MTRSHAPSSLATGRKIGILGGTFNPIHRCHLTLAREVRDRLGLDQILFIPCGDPPHKPKLELAPAHHRTAMIRLAIEGEPAFAVSEVETRRAGKSYSIDTVTQLRQEMGPGTNLYFLIGLDAFLDFAMWRRAQDLLTACHFVVVSRPGAQFAQLSAMTLLPDLDTTALLAADQGRANDVTISLRTGRELHLIHIPPCLVSASIIRERLLLGMSVEGLLPPPVEHYIIREALYQESHNPTRFQG